MIFHDRLSPFATFCVEAIQSSNSNMFLLLTVTAGHIIDVQRGTSPSSGQCLATAVGGKGSRVREVDPASIGEHGEHAEGQSNNLGNQFFLFVLGVITQPVRSLLLDGRQHAHESLLPA